MLPADYVNEYEKEEGKRVHYWHDLHDRFGTMNTTTTSTSVVL